MAYLPGMPHTWSYDDTIDRLVFLKLEVFFHQERSPNKRRKKGIRHGGKKYVGKRSEPGSSGSCGLFVHCGYPLDREAGNGKIDSTSMRPSTERSHASHLEHKVHC